MLNCPNCQMLMDDHELLCSSCTGLPPSGQMPHDPAAHGRPAHDRPAHDPSAEGQTEHGQPAHHQGVAGTATALLERPAPIADPMPSLKYRDPRGRRRSMRAVAVAVLVAGAGAAVVVYALRGEGPIADAAVEAGLVAPPVVSVPSSWTSMSSDDGSFRVQMPVGATEVDALGSTEQVDGPAPRRVHGVEAALGAGGTTAVASFDLGLTPEAFAQLDDPVAFDALVDSLAFELGVVHGAGAETVRRDVPTGNGRAVDVVMADESIGSTTRARFLLADDRVYMVVTGGLDVGASRLDKVHSRVLSSLRTSADGAP